MKHSRGNQVGPQGSKWKRSRKKSQPSKPALPEDLDGLVEAIASDRLILFVGDGISQSLGLPNIRALVNHLASDLGFSAELLQTAEYAVIAEAYLLKHGKLGPLRAWMDSTWHPAKVDITKSEIRNLIVDLELSTIYTTNYDRWLEIAFEKRKRPFHKIANVADLAADARGRTEIIKFHGDFADDDSLVLTEASYFQRMIFESPLDIRLRSDCLARPLLFLGYSLHDVNTRYLLFRLQELWKSSPYADQRPVSYIAMTERDLAQEIVLRARGVHPIVLEGDPSQATTTFLRQISQAAQTLRKNRHRTPQTKLVSGNDSGCLLPFKTPAERETGM
jgi:NAD-dependent SIR2 family protein deacetylase